jgi:hypothetical protein
VETNRDLAKAICIALVFALIAETCWSTEREPILAVSLVQLIVNPEKYEGKTIQTKGYLHDAGVATLFLTREHAIMGDIDSAIVVWDDTGNALILRGPCLDRFVLVEGRVANRPGWGGWSLIEVGRISGVGDSQCEWRRPAP